MKRFLSIKNPEWMILTAAILFRFLLLTNKPPHFDEGINGWFVDQIYSKGFYQYDPTNYHGPLHFYILLFTKLLFGRSIWSLRLSACAFGVLSVWMILRMQEFWGRTTCRWAAAFAAVSPGLVFYSRYAIHESELWFFSLIAIYGYFRHRRYRDKTSLWCMALGVVAMAATKETFFVHMICWGVAVWLERRSRRGDDDQQVTTHYTRRDVMNVIMFCTLCWFLLYTGFLMDLGGAVRFFQSFAAWFKTGSSGVGQGKPIYYWLTLFYRYEWLALIGLLAIPYFIHEPNRELRTLVIYACGVLAAYSLIAYKTPWCIMNILWPFQIAAIHVLCENFAKKKQRAAIAFLACILVATTVRSANLNFWHPADPAEPYAYVQTEMPYLDFVARLQKLIKRDPTNRFMPINIFMNSQWPLPWQLGDFPHVNYFGQIPFDMNHADAALILCDVTKRLELEKRLKNHYRTIDFPFRTYMENTAVYYDVSVWGDLIPPNATEVANIPQPVVEPQGEGLLGYYYDNVDFKGLPKSIRVHKTLDFRWEGVDRAFAAPLGIIFIGEIYIPQTKDPILFSLASDDGSRLFIDNKMIIDNWGAHALTEKQKVIRIAGGWHKIKIRYTDFGGGAIATLQWQIPPETKLHVVPSTFLRYHQIRPEELENK